MSEIKIRVIGACGSGKSYISRELSKKYNLSYYELDNIVWDRCKEDTKYPLEIRDSNLKNITKSNSWIIEGTHSSWTFDSFKEADLIFILNPNVLFRDYRIIRRFVRTRFGLERWNYKQTFNNLIKMIVEWNHGFEIGKVISITNEFSNKRYFVKNKEEIIKCIDTYFLK